MKHARQHRSDHPLRRLHFAAGIPPRRLRARSAARVGSTAAICSGVKRLIETFAKSNLRIFLALLALVMAAQSAGAVGTAMLAWNRNPESNVAGYRVYYGSKAGSYSQVVDVGNQIQAEIVNLAPGNVYYFVVTAYNTSGDESMPSAEVFKVMPANQPPVVSLQSSLGAVALVAPASLSIEALATDTDGTVMKVEFFQNGQKVATDLSAPFVLPWSSTAAGSYSIMAVATDNSGATGQSASLVIQVTAPSFGITRMNGDGTFQFTAETSGSEASVVEVSEDCRTWSAMSKITVMEDGGFLDPDAPNLRKRFYRVRSGGVLLSNVVGFARIAAPAGYSIIGSQFVNGSNTMNEVFGNAPEGATFFKYDAVRKQFAVNNYFGPSFGWDQRGQVLLPGEAGFLYNPATNAVDIVLQGRLPLGRSTVPMHAGYSIVCHPMPMSGVVGRDLDYPQTEGDILFRYRKGRFLISNYFESVKRWDFPPDLNVGEGFYLYRQVAGTWERNFSVGQ
ncbi:MAG: fibronectin type III domain-containing protein [Verrucomicrobiae bacterium]|nr:fibronectin type III domain-containing protein [Verrucomicrobiae bacterium]